MTQPIAMFLTCPGCNARHIDEGEFASRPHHTHACQSCGLTWRPAIEHTTGVQFLPGFKNEPKPVQQPVALAQRYFPKKGDRVTVHAPDPWPGIPRGETARITHVFTRAQLIGDIKGALSLLQITEQRSANTAFDALYELERRMIETDHRLTNPSPPQPSGIALDMTVTFGGTRVVDEVSFATRTYVAEHDMRRFEPFLIPRATPARVSFQAVAAQPVAFAIPASESDAATEAKKTRAMWIKCASHTDLFSTVSHALALLQTTDQGAADLGAAALVEMNRRTTQSDREPFKQPPPDRSAFDMTLSPSHAPDQTLTTRIVVPTDDVYRVAHALAPDGQQMRVKLTMASKPEPAIIDHATWSRENMQARIDKLERALQWYAWPDRYVPVSDGNVIGIGPEFIPEAERDLGKLAREALTEGRMNNVAVGKARSLLRELRMPSPKPLAEGQRVTWGDQPRRGKVTAIDTTAWVLWDGDKRDTLHELAALKPVPVELYECEACSKKPGAPQLCETCIANRRDAGDQWIGLRPKTSQSG